MKKTFIVLCFLCAMQSSQATSLMQNETCATFSGTDVTDKRLRKNLDSGSHEKSAAHSVGKMLGNRLRQNNLSNWVLAYMMGYAAASNEPAPTQTSDQIKTRLMAYCSEHTGDTLTQAAEALWKSATREN